MAKKYIKKAERENGRKDFWNLNVHPITWMPNNELRYNRNKKPLITEYVPT